MTRSVAVLAAARVSHPRRVLRQGQGLSLHDGRSSPPCRAPRGTSCRSGRRRASQSGWRRILIRAPLRFPALDQRERWPSAHLPRLRGAPGAAVLHPRGDADGDVHHPGADHQQRQPRAAARARVLGWNLAGFNSRGRSIGERTISVTGWLVPPALSLGPLRRLLLGWRARYGAGFVAPAATAVVAFIDEALALLREGPLLPTLDLPPTAAGDATGAWLSGPRADQPLSWVPPVSLDQLDRIAAGLAAAPRLWAAERGLLRFARFAVEVFGASASAPPALAEPWTALRAPARRPLCAGAPEVLALHRAHGSCLSIRGTLSSRSAAGAPGTPRGPRRTRRAPPARTADGRSCSRWASRGRGRRGCRSRRWQRAGRSRRGPASRARGSGLAPAGGGGGPRLGGDAPRGSPRSSACPSS